MPNASARREFDAAYYDRFYRNARTRAVSQADTANLAAFVLAYMRRLDIPVRSALDVGCGLGFWRDALSQAIPGLNYTGVETSAYLCQRFGWQQAPIDTFRSRRRYDLVICQSVLQYVDDAAVSRGLANVARLCRGVLYLEIVTAEDWAENCDRQRTDGEIHRRPAAWYRRHIRRHFRSCGGGVYVPKDSDVVLYELEKGRD